MTKNLVIVESPAKAKTIEGFLGKDYTVKSSFGHVRDLVKKGMGVDPLQDFLPNYEISEDKKKVIVELSRIVKGAEVVWLATDEDREGEAISWHLFETLGLKKSATKRIVFHEITPKAIKDAIASPREIDMNLVNAQQARRILDRLVGFELSPVLWKKIKPSLSAGRVQSVTVRLIVEREREIQHFQSESYFKVVGFFTTQKGEVIQADLTKKIKATEEIVELLERCKTAKFKVDDLAVTPAKRTPSAPFTTSTLQQEASRKLSFSVAQTMSVAQRLYESGKITYMRTDSVNLSEFALDAAATEIKTVFGEKYHQPRQFKTKSKSAQEAHEAIRPTYMNVQKVEGDSQEQRLYDLIWKRTMASQMSDAQLEKTTITIGSSNESDRFVATGEVIRFDGFLKLYMESTDDENAAEENTGLLPAVKISEGLGMNEIKATQKFTYHPPRYTEASLVKKLEELGIGRPSTYAPTISTVQKRGYVVKEDRDGVKREYLVFTLNNNQIVNKTEIVNFGAEKSKLFPTDIGMVVTDFLLQHFVEIMDFNFTANVEKEFDEIAEGNIEWQKMIAAFYTPFHKHVESTTQNSDRASGERLLGNDPVSGLPMFARIGRYGPLIQMGESEGENKPRYANLKKDQRIESITLENALELFRLPRTLGEFEASEMTVGEGRFGPYIKHAGAFYSIPKTDDPLEINADRGVELILAKRKRDAERLIKVFPENPDYQLLNGRWGPYLAVGKQNFKIPKGTEPSSLSYDDCLKITGGLVEAVAKTAASKKTTPVKKAASKKSSGTVKKAAAKKSSPKKSAAKKAAPAKKKPAAKKTK
jgi:DNA topoisomerase I